MQDTIVMIDGENFRHYTEHVLGILKIKKTILDIDINKLLSGPLKGINVSGKFYYSAKVHFFKPDGQKSLAIISRQRFLKTELEKQGFVYELGGHVRPQLVINGKNKKVVFKEKGIDVKIAVDLLTLACDKVAKSVVLCSSDSDLQPAIKEARKRGLNIIYLGFEPFINKGLVTTTNRTIIVRNEEIKESII